LSELDLALFDGVRTVAWQRRCLPEAHLTCGIEDFDQKATTRLVSNPAIAYLLAQAARNHGHLDSLELHRPDRASNTMPRANNTPKPKCSLAGAASVSLKAFPCKVSGGCVNQAPSGALFSGSSDQAPSCPETHSAKTAAYAATGSAKYS